MRMSTIIDRDSVDVTVDARQGSKDITLALQYWSPSDAYTVTLTADEALAIAKDLQWAAEQAANANKQGD